MTHSLDLELPDGESRDFPRSPVLDRVDPCDSSLFVRNDEIRVLEKFWDDPHVRHSMQAGTTRFSVLVRRVPSDVPEDTELLSGLAKYLDKDIHEYFAEFNRGAVPSETTDPLAKPPESYNAVEIAGRDWLHYGFPSDPGISVYVTPLGSRIYLKLHFNQIGSGGGRKEWRAESDALRDEILDRLVLTEK